MNRVLEHEPSLLDVAQICATCDVDTVPLPSPDVLPPVPPLDPLSALVPPLVSPLVPVGAAAVETPIEGFTDAEELAVLLSIPASEAALPVPLALAPVPAPLLLAVALPSANAFVSAVRALVSTEPSESASMCALAEAEPLPTELAETSTLADDAAEAEPSLPVLAAEPEASAAADPPMTPPPEVETSMSASAAEAEDAEVSSAVVVVWPSAKAWPWASPSAAEEPVRVAEATVPSSVAEFAVAEPVAEAPAPDVTRSTPAVTSPSLLKVAAVSPSAVEASVAVSFPVALALVDTDESAVLPVVPSLWALALPPADADAPAPSADAAECESELAKPPPAVAWLSELALAEAALAVSDSSQPVSMFGAIGAADSMRAKALVESTRPSLKRRELCI